jgi:gas vesicle protein
MAHNDELPYVVIEHRSGGLSGLVWGALLGAGVALLFAPRSGRETRDRLRDQAYRLRDAAESKVREVQDALTDSIDEVRREVGERVDAARAAIDAGRETARHSRADFDRRVREARATEVRQTTVRVETDEEPEGFV